MTRFFTYLTFFALGTVLGSFQVCAAPPEKLAVRYELSRNGTVVAEVNEVLAHDGRIYRIDSEARGRGIFALASRAGWKRSSVGQIEAGALLPGEYRDQRGDRNPEIARFDWAKRIVILEHDGKQQTVNFKGLMQDRVSFFWSFAFTPLPGKEIVLDIAEGRSVARFHYEIGRAHV